MDEKSSLPRLAFSVEEFGQIIGAGRTTVFNEIKAGRLEAIKIGNLTRITREAGERYVKNLPRRKPSEV